MASAGSNPHKKGEHVFNDIGGSLENALMSALSDGRLHAPALTSRHGPLKLQDFAQTVSGLQRFQRDPVLVQARTITAAATGTADDINSLRYGRTRRVLDLALADAVVGIADLIWNKRPQANSSYHQFEAVVTGLKSGVALKTDAAAAFSALVDSAHDPGAEQSVLTERASNVEIARRRAIITTMKQQFPLLKQRGQALIRTFFEEFESAIERRVQSAG